MCAYYLILFVLSTISFGLIQANSTYLFRGYVTKTNGVFEVYSEANDSYVPPSATANVVAEGLWDQSYNVTGWSVLEVQTNDTQTNIDQVYAAGLLEGQITREYITYQRMNNIDDICRNRADFCTKLGRFFQVQLEWIYDQIDKYPNSDYWHQINLLLVQLNGLIDGYAETKPAPGPKRIIADPINGLFLFQVVESSGDLAARLDVDMSTFERRDSCSALVKILSDKQDILVSHADWSHYRTMLKVIKRYKMSLKYLSGNRSIPGSETIFSSYPGTLHSIDDFYMSYPSNMVVIETTIGNNNQDLFKNILPISVPEWMRIVVANRLSNNGDEWMNKFFLFNDGTYSNQWMVSDYKKFTAGQDPQDGFLTVGEQMITYYKWDDFTKILINNTYWASYNNVYYPSFRNYSQEDLKAAVLPQLYSWVNSSRAQIFRREHDKVKDPETMMKLMRYNNFTTDPLSSCDCPKKYSAELSIAARCDLNPPGNYSDPALGLRPHGATDAKITGFNMLNARSLNAIAGPTTEYQPPFQWSTSNFSNILHIAHPDIWNFTTFTPQWKL